MKDSKGKIIGGTVIDPVIPADDDNNNHFKNNNMKIGDPISKSFQQQQGQPKSTATTTNGTTANVTIPVCNGVVEGPCLDPNTHSIIL